MRSTLKFTLITIILLMFSFSCQEEEAIIENPPAEDIIEAESSLVNSMRMVSANDGSVDNLLDNSSCTEIELPVTVTINQTTVTVTTLEELWMLEDLFMPSNNVVDFTFPIVLVLEDYTEITINSQDEFDALVAECTLEPEVIECVDFQYPISFSIYNTDFQVIDTVEIANDEELYAFLLSIDAPADGVVLASLNFPVTLEYANGETLEVDSNQALEEAINNAEEDCNYANCEEEQVDNYLTECHWNIVSIGGDSETFANIMIYFNEDGTAYMVDGDTLVSFGDIVWSTSTSDTGAGVVVSLSNIESGAEIMNGDWLVNNCNINEFVMTQETASGTVEFILSQDCTEIEDPFGCFGDMAIVACDYDGDGIATFDLEAQVLGTIVCDVDYSATFHETLMDAEGNMNQFSMPSSYQNTSNPATIYLRVENSTGVFQVFEIELSTVECTSNCSEIDVDNYLQSCTWTITDYNGSGSLAVYELNFDSDGSFTIVGDGLDTTAYWSTSETPENGVVVEFINVAGPNIQAITGEWVVSNCQGTLLEFEELNGSSTMVMERNGCYTAEELLVVVAECQWEISSLTTINEDLTSNYDDVVFTFFENEFAFAEVGDDDINYGDIEPLISGDELLVLFHLYGFTSDINGYYEIQSITEDEIIFVVEDYKELVLQKTCTNGNQDADTEEIKSWLYDGVWEVTTYMEGSDNLTSEFNESTFDFQDYANLLAIDAGLTNPLDMDYEVLRDGSGNLRMVINYLGITPYFNMAGDWYITDVSSTSIEIHQYNSTTGIEEIIILEKQ